MRWWGLLVALLFLRAVFGQDLTVLSEIADPAEKQAFLNAYQSTEPVKRVSLARAFVKAYPQSWLLAQAYDILARAAVALGDYPAGVSAAEFSLRLLPENPTLAVLVANVRAVSGDYAAARRLAQDVLEDLERFQSPMKAQLMASAFFVLGRAAASEAMRVKPQDRRLLEQALGYLNRSVACNASDSEAFYLRGIVEVALGQRVDAANDFGFVAASGGGLQERAMAQLRLLPVEAARLYKPKIDLELRQPRVLPMQAEAIRAGYAGSASCQGCHAREYSTWAETGMATMLRPYRPENLMSNFREQAAFNDSIRVGMGARPYFDVKDGAGQWRRFPVDYTIGSKWQQAYATALPNGAIHVLPIEYNGLQKRWINYWETIDAPGNQRTVISEFPKLSGATNYQENCAVCHTSQLRAKATDEAPIDHAAFREPGVNCEMCHGPSALHAKQMKAGGMQSKDALAPPVDFRRIDHREGVRICAQCHRQSVVRQMGAGQAMNYSTGSTGFVPDNQSQPFDVFLRRAFYKDGRLRQTTFMVEAFTRSACYRKGEAQCASCHAPHLGNFAGNQTALKFKQDENEMCLQCHREYAGKAAQHSRHAAGSEGSQCVACHMPRIMNALEFQARSHQIEIPRADLTERFGQAESPNACLLCHQRKDAGWVSAELKKYGPPS